MALRRSFEPAEMQTEGGIALRSPKTASRGVLAGLLAVATGLVLLTACRTEKASLAAYASTVQAGQLTAADGYIEPDETVSPFDDFHPAIGNLQPALRKALQEAARDAAADGVEMHVTDGWRSVRYQEVLLDAAVRLYASREEAAKWVATPEESRHVSGNAVDIGPTDANSWLNRHGADYGLCQTYANEMWHFELAVEPGGKCPAPVRDASSG